MTGRLLFAAASRAHVEQSRGRGALALRTCARLLRKNKSSYQQQSRTARSAQPICRQRQGPRAGRDSARMSGRGEGAAQRSAAPTRASRLRRCVGGESGARRVSTHTRSVTLRLAAHLALSRWSRCGAAAPVPRSELVTARCRRTRETRQRSATRQQGARRERQQRPTWRWPPCSRQRRAPRPRPPPCSRRRRAPRPRPPTCSRLRREPRPRPRPCRQRPQPLSRRPQEWRWQLPVGRLTKQETARPWP